MSTRRVPEYNAAGEIAHYRTVQVTDHRVRFGKPDWDVQPSWPDRAVNRRPVLFDGKPVGDLYGLISPGQPNPNRPTGYLFIDTDGKQVDGIDRLESARSDIEHHIEGYALGSGVPEEFVRDDEQGVWMYRGHAVRRSMPDTGSYEVLLVTPKGWHLVGAGAKTLYEAKQKIDRRMP